MAKAISVLIRRKRGESGQAMAEFTLVLAFIALVCVIALTAIGGAVIGPFESFVSGLA
jgi:Flp pilus assembly pilin Flp